MPPLYTTRMHPVDDRVRERAPVNASSPAQAARLFGKHLRGADREHLVVLLLNSHSQALGLLDVHIGTVDEVYAIPRDIFRPAIAAGAASIIIAHNHPSGSVVPSQADLRVTRRVMLAGELIGIPCLDHLIITDKAWCSCVPTTSRTKKKGRKK
jgi:DNA repair protein RadC